MVYSKLAVMMYSRYSRSRDPDRLQPNKQPRLEALSYLPELRSNASSTWLSPDFISYSWITPSFDVCGTCDTSSLLIGIDSNPFKSDWSNMMLNTTLFLLITRV